MTGNLLGEPVLDFVKSEVENRQKLFGKGITDGQNRSINELSYINNRNAWIKLASSVFINDKNRLPNGLPSSEGFLGKELAQKSILFNSLSSLKDSSYTFRSGVDKTVSFWNQNFYGLGGTQQGIVPPPGIENVSIESRNNGSIRTATINLKAYNRFQFEIIELLYLRLGFTVLLEFGWDKYLDEKGKIKNVESTLTEDVFFTKDNLSQFDMIQSIQEKQSFYKGNYDGFFGRVKNFSWDFGNDGTYTIKIDLITLGDVIESLKVNIPPTNEQKNEMGVASKEEVNKYTQFGDSILLANKANSKLSAYLYNTIGSTKFDTPDYYNLAAAISYQDPSYKYSNKLDLNYNYFIRFGELISVLEKEVIPNIKPLDQQLYFEANAIDTTLINHSPNLVSFDPRVCIFKYDDGALNQDSISDIYVPQYTNSLKPSLTRITGVSKQKPTQDPFLQNTDSSGFIGPQEEPLSSEKSDINAGDIVFLKLYNIYLNYAFIFQILEKNTDKEGNLSVYKFLEAVCDGINSSFANVTQITPQIKDDKVVTFVERKPPLALIKNLDKIKGSTSGETVELEVYGFNPQKKSSNFLKNIKFNTKIGPRLANQISIGATASGTTVGEDATAFSKWNKGLVDRFNKEASVKSTTETNTKTKPKNDNTSPPEENDITKVKYEGDDRIVQNAITKGGTTLLADKISFPHSIEVEHQRGSTTRYYLNDQNEKKRIHSNKLVYSFQIDKDGNIIDDTLYEKLKIDGKLYDRITSSSDTTQKTTKYSNITPGFKTLVSLIQKQIQKELIKLYGAVMPSEETQNEKSEADNAEFLERGKQLANINYSAYLAQMFGGSPNIDQEQSDSVGADISTINKGDTHYFPNSNNEFVNVGKSSYKLYLENYFGKSYNETGNPSNQAGFIPVEFSLEMEGLSGWKIYNKINIQQSFLPPQYSATLEFLVTKVNHQINGDGWSTNLSTLSTSNIDSPPSIKFNPGPKIKEVQGNRNISGGFAPGDLFTFNKKTTRNAAPLKSNPSIPVENGFLHKYPGMLVEADASLYSRLVMNNYSDNKRFRLHYAAMPHFINLLNAYEKAISENGKTFLERYGKLKINSAYRSISDTPNSSNAASPGKSRHGLGVAIDIQQPSSYAEVHQWFKDNGPSLGWMRIPLLRSGVNETWHWELQFEGPYAKLTSSHIGESNIKESGKNGAKQYAVSSKQVTGVNSLKPSYMLNTSLFELQKSTQI